MLPVQTLTFDLRTRTADFGTALRRLDRALPRRRREEAVLSHDGEMLHIELGGGTLTVPAEGTCDAQVRVSAAALLRFPRVLPRDPVLHLRALDYRLGLGPCSLPCSIQPAWSKVVDLPAGTSTEDALRALIVEDAEDLVASGLAPFILAHQRTLIKVIAEDLAEQGLLDFDGHGSGSERW
ncbi:hypothetical protein [Haloferula sp. A504]|uniref:hypothetical protein n=1 Tax=Haloferula sp. A504 TaxID=3373601 RepID=UPI0031C4680D|nr:hypothetical protein [Verrucomicrobiaceae bacterium E54]